ncbi:MAG: uridine monophosphate kinase [bacterium]
MTRPSPEKFILKVSGELLSGYSKGVYDDKMITAFVRNLKEVIDNSVKSALLVGGGNILRGSEMERFGLKRVSADQAGMVATIVNGIILKDWLSNYDINSTIFSPISVGSLAKEYIPQEAKMLMDSGGVPILAGGTGNAYFTTDTAVVLRGIELGVDVVLKGTKVKGLFTDDPMIEQSSEFIENINYKDYLDNNYRVMDLTSIVLAMQYKIPIIIFNIFELGNLNKVINGENIGTYISEY